MIKDKILSIEASSRRLTFIGDESLCGTYVLRFRVIAPLKIACGRFKNGKLIAFERGDYLYVGSAMGEDRSAVCLARRLVRHATRLGDHLPHPIREMMFAEFPAVGLATYNLVPTTPKQPKWNVDYVLDQVSVDLVEAFIIRNPARAEASIGKYLEMDPSTAVIEPGLGANDIAGNTHLLRAAADEQWWRKLPTRLRTVTRLAAVHGDETVRNALEGVLRADWQITDKNLGSLTRMSRERAADILRRLTRGCAYTRADRESQGTFDTTGWAEVRSRLARGRGGVRISAAILEGRCGAIVPSGDQWKEIATLAMQLKQETGKLKQHVARIAGGRATKKTEELDAFDMRKVRTFNQVAGKLKLCTKFIVKSDRDLSALVVHPTNHERECIHTDLARIAAASDRIIRECSHKQTGYVRRASS